MPFDYPTKWKTNAQKNRPQEVWLYLFYYDNEAWDDFVAFASTDFAFQNGTTGYHQAHGAVTSDISITEKIDIEKGVFTSSDFNLTVANIKETLLRILVMTTHY